MKPETKELVELTNRSYDEYNDILPIIKQRLGADRVPLFEATLTEELPLTTARRAYVTAIKVALGEKAYREVLHQKKIDFKKAEVKEPIKV